LGRSKNSIERVAPLKIVQPEVLFETPFGILTEHTGVDLLRWIETNARISHRSEERQTADSWKRFIQSIVIDKGDWSVVEHASLTAIVKVNRGITHEWVRHRLFSFTQESTRFVNYSKPNHEAEFIISGEVKPADEKEWIADLEVIESVYRKWLREGYAPQIARDFLPNALATRMSITGNLRNWRHFFLMRTTSETHPDMRRVAIPMLRKVQSKIPLLFDDIVPETKQSISIARAR
jgi:thymidylate synthase (FAD)